ncbi:unnamed protein product [Linum tenue]|uniref:Peptidase A1 domain-containing protein n=1 Tax=Linum tenue TaxID=586396 RepID=A0AAV0IB94_9ROSI|nr:unnamed protein product [Linum tenue]
MRALHLLITLLILFLSTPSDALRITTRLIHRDSRFSPLYDAAATAADRAERSVRASLARLQLASSLSSTTSDDDQGAAAGNNDNIEAPLVLAVNQNLFYVNFSIGEPPVPQLAVMDTGSSFSWVKCLPCNLCSSPSPGSGATFFDPLQSRTYTPRSCTKECRRCTTGTGPSYCMYAIDYLSGHSSSGVYSTDQLTFRTSDDGVTTVPDVQFGCCHNLTGIKKPDQHATGILALSGKRSLPFGETPLVVRLGSVFSYCIGSIFDRSYLYNRLSIGAGDADLAGDSTPFITDHIGHYFLQLQNISLGGQVLDIPSQVFTKISNQQGITLDSGSELSFLYTDAFDVVKSEVQKLASSVLTEVPGGKGAYELCYRGSVNVEAQGFPVLGLHFADDADLVVDNTGMFYQVEEDVFCLAVLRSNSVSIVGVMAQQGYNVGYDLKASRVYFQDIDCQLLEG